MPQPHIRLATPEDAAVLQAIYAPYVRDTTVSFELEPPDTTEIRRRMENILAMYPWLLCEVDGEPAGYAYASRFHPRQAYQWTVETSVYIARDLHRQGLARTLYAALFRILRAQGLINALAGISLPNPASVAFHEALGFVPVRTMPKVGFKHGRWLDVGYWQLTLQPHPEAPEPPRALPEVRNLASLLVD